MLTTENYKFYFKLQKSIKKAVVVLALKAYVLKIKYITLVVLVVLVVGEIGVLSEKK